MRKGRKSASQTPAPLKDRIYGSDKNKVGSASSEKSAKNISLSVDILVALTKKLKEFKKENPNSDNITLNDLKAVYRRGLGAYSSTHRTTITGGVPNTRNAWAMARVNKFLKKASGEKVKKAYVQDDDLMKYSKGGLIAPNGKKSNLTPEQYNLVRTPEFKGWFGDWENDPENSSKVVDENGEPMVMYHASTSEKIYYEFDKDKINLNDPDFWCNGFWFSKEKGSTSWWTNLGGEVFIRPYFLNLRNPLLEKDEDKYYEQEVEPYDYSDTKNRLILIKNGYDGVEFLSSINLESLKKQFYDLNETIYINSKTHLKLKIDGKMVFYVVYENNRGVDAIYISLEDGTKVTKEWIETQLENLVEDKIYIAFEPNQIKLADGTNTTFDNNNPDIRYNEGGKISWSDYVKSQFNEEEDRYLPSDYFGEYQIKSNTKQNFDLILRNINNLEYRLKNNTQNTIGVFDNEKQVAEADNKAIEVSPIYQKKGIGLELVTILKERNPNHRFASMTPQGWNLMGSYYDKKLNSGGNLKNNNMFETLGKLFRPQNINYIAKEQNVSEEYARMQLAKGIEHEFEHTNDYETAKTIALHHLAENIDYYIMLEKAENQVKDKNYDDHFKQVYAQGGSINFEFQTPTGKPTKLTYLQQVLVRTSSFKKWFGDWEKSAKEYIITDDFEKSFSGVSKCLDMETLEPRVVFHGTRTNEEFFVFNANMKGGRPYGYFAVNEQYSENFTTSSQTGLGNNPYLYRVFLSVKNPFKAVGHSFDTKMKNAEYWKTIIAGQIQWQKTKSLEKDERLTKAVESQIGRFVDEICSTGDVPFWMFMSRDRDSIFKRFLMSWGFDSVEFSENIRENFDVNNPSEFTYAYTIFDAPQVKLADGRNVEFNMQSDDMRYENGGNLNDEDMNKYEHLKSVIGGEGYHAEPIYKSGGSVQSHGNNKKDDATKGGYFVGRPHSQGGIKAINISTNSPIEVEGGEVIITKPAVEDNKKRMFEGEMLTNREILSKINQSGGGVPIFEEGGMCGCSGKKYNFGGNVVEDFRGIYDYMVKPYIVEPISETMQYVDSLIIKRKK